MKFMAAGELKKRASSVIDEVYETGEGVTITKNGEPVAMLVAFREKPDEIFGFMKGKGRIVGDLVEPITPAEDWSDDILPSTRKSKKKQ